MKKPGCWMLLCGTALIIGCALPLGEDFEIGGGGYARTAASFAGGGDNSVLSIMEKYKEAASTVEIVMDPGTEPVTPGVTFVYGLPDGTSPKEVLINGKGRTLQVGATNLGSPLITVGEGVELTLKNITLQGRDNRSAPLVEVAAGGKLILDSGAVITGNENTAGSSAGGVKVAGTLVMTGTAEISDNDISADYTGGGVYVAPGGDFTLIRGVIKRNGTPEIFTWSTPSIDHTGLGVYVASGGKFAMEGGSITFCSSGGQDWPSTGSYSGSAGVFAAGEFAMKGGEIKGNIGDELNGGVWVESGSSPNDGFTMSGGTITDNTSANYSGGVWIEKGKFIMKGGNKGGNVDGNTTTNSKSDGNVHVRDPQIGEFKPEGGNIGNDSADKYEYGTGDVEKESGGDNNNDDNNNDDSNE
jgi:hypothetical protein